MVATVFNFGHKETSNEIDGSEGGEVLTDEHTTITSENTYVPKWGYGTEIKPTDELQNVPKLENIGNNVSDYVGDIVQNEIAFKDITNEVGSIKSHVHSSDKEGKLHMVDATNLDNDDEGGDEYIDDDIPADELHALAEREKHRINKEIKIYQGSKSFCQQKLSIIETDIFKLTQEIESFRKTMNLNQNELDQWVKAATKKEDDNLALRKYSRADEVKIKDLNLTIEKLTSFSVLKRAELENAITETQTKQTELDRTADAFKSQHNERRHLVKQWQDTIETMQARDKEISDISIEYIKSKNVNEEKKQILTESKNKLILQQAGNEDATQLIEDTERSLQNRRNEQNECLKEQQEVADELDSLKNELNATENSLRQALTHNKGFKEQLHSKEAYLEGLIKRFEKMRLQLQAEQKETLTKEEAAKYAEEVILDREETLKSSEKTINSLKERIFKQRQQLTSLRDNENLLESDIRNSQSQMKLLSSQIRDLESEGTRQKELVYNAEYQLQQMEQKVARGLGERSDEELRQLKARISELEAEFNAHHMKRKALAQQYRKLQHELRSWIKRKDGNEERQNTFLNDIAEIELAITSFELSLRAQVTNKEEAMISHDTMRLDVKRLRDALWNQTGEVQSLEAKRDQFSISMSEKKRELQNEAGIQSTKMRFAEEERHKNALELAQRRIVAEKLRAKYEVLRKGGCGVDNPDREHSQVYLLITMAQKREELQREGDNLDRKIREKEKEMRALDKTLLHLQDRNTRFRKSFAKIDMGSSEGRELASLGDKIQVAQEKSFLMKSNIRRLQSEYRDGMQHLQTLNNNISSLDQGVRHLSETNKNEEGELKQNEAHVNIMVDEVQTLSFTHRKNAGYPIETFTPKEQQIRSKILQDSAKYLVGTLKELAKELNMKLPELESYLTGTIESI